MDVLLKIEEIAKRENVTLAKAAVRFFAANPEAYEMYKRENSALVGRQVQKSGRSKSKVMADIDYECTLMARSLKLDLNNASDAVKVCTRVFQDC